MKISIQEVIDKKLAVVDLTASIMCMEHKMPMMVFALNEENSIVNTVHGKCYGTKVTSVHERYTVYWQKMHRKGGNIMDQRIRSI